MKTKKEEFKETVSILNTIFKCSVDVPDVPITRSHRINDKSPKKIDGFTSSYSHKEAVIDYVKRNPRCVAKSVSASLCIPHPTVLNILSKAFISKILMREALKENLCKRPSYVYWVEGHEGTK